jgi:tetratricopeptide (TPR) repeat protein
MWALRSLGMLIASALIGGGLAPGSSGAQAGSADQAALHYQRLLERRPGDPRLWARLADACIQKARATGDVGYFGRAEAALRKALELDPRHGEAVRQLAFVLYSRHDFEGAAREARRALALDPGDRHAYGVLGDALLEVGRYAEARETYATMMRLGRDLYTLSRRAGLRSLTGDPEGAIDDLGRAIEAGRASAEPPESLAWAEWQLGNEHFALGRLGAAEARYRAALATYPGYHRGAAGLAHVRAAQGRHADAIELYRKALDVVPLPEYAAALGDLYARIGRRQEAEKQYALVEYIGRLSTLNQVLYNRELAYFYADHELNLAEALRLARRELDVRQDVYASDLLAWALLKNGRAADAVDPITTALRLDTQDAKLHFHAGLIYRALGQTELARAHLGRALALNPHFHLLHADTAARALQALGEGRP